MKTPKHLENVPKDKLDTLVEIFKTKEMIIDIWNDATIGNKPYDIYH